MQTDNYKTNYIIKQQNHAIFVFVSKPTTLTLVVPADVHIGILNLYS